MSGTFEDANGNKSSKRLIGAILIGSGGLFLIALGTVSIFKVVADPGTAIEVGKTLVTAGALLLGVGVLEGAGKAISNIGGGK